MIGRANDGGGGVGKMSMFRLSLQVLGCPVTNEAFLVC